MQHNITDTTGTHGEKQLRAAGKMMTENEFNRSPAERFLAFYTTPPTPIPLA